MTNQEARQRHLPPLTVNVHAVAARLDMLASAGLCPRCDQIITPVMADAVALLAEVIRLHEAVRSARLESANRLAAIQAALHAAEDGETDPLAYLRDEIPGSGRGWPR